MRLHMVRLRAFGPYAAEQVIDFGRLAGSGLFLLEGPTGAGKTTILDAVTFALYGGLSGEGSGSDRLHSGFAGPDVEPSVTVEFSLRGVRYRITRVPEHQRPKKRGEGYTTQPMRVHLERRDSAGWTSLTSNKAEAGVMVTEAVGLNRAQFTQVMLLPQGEFARFLRCGDDDRRALLTKLFGTELYDRITAQLDNGRADALRERRESAVRIENALAAAAEAAGLGQAERTGLLALPGPDRAVGLKDIAAELAAAMTTGEKKLTAAGDRLAAARASDAQAQQRAERMARLTGVLAKLREHESTRADQDRRAARLAAARQAEPVRPLLAAASEAEAAARVARAGLLRLIPAPDESMLAGLGGREAAARAEADAQEAAGLQHLVDEETGLADQEEMLAGLDEAAQQAAARVSALTAARSELPDRIRRLEEECAAARAAAAGADGARARLDTVAKQLAAARQLQELEPEAAAALADLQAAVDRHQALVDEHQALADARLSGIAAELAGRLSGGEPCPVCGSCTHPAPACADAGAVSAEDVEAARQQRDDAAAERERLEREHAVLAREVAGCAAVADGKSAGELSAEADRLSAAVAAAEQAAAQAAELAAAVSAAREEQGAVDGQTLAAEKELAARSGRLTTARDGLARLRSRLAAAAGDHPSVAARQAALRESASHHRSVAAALDQLADAAASQEKSRARAEREASGRGFASLAEAQAAALDPAGLADLEAQVMSWQDTLAGLTGAARDPGLADLDPAAAGRVRQAAEQAAEELAEAAEAEAAARRERDGAAYRADRFGACLADVHQAEEDHERLTERTEAVIRLAGLAKGTEGHRRVALTTYVLRHWFGQVVAAANLRLGAMSAGRYELIRTDQAESKRARSGLTLAVIDRHTGEERSPASLSGGETFYTSLALALGLADVVRAEAGGVDLDTLFIDEGFGSLDAGTLDQVMAVIDDLRERGRAVGIVSHVADLKDRVPERLEIRRLPDGSSEVRVVA